MLAIVVLLLGISLVGWRVGWWFKAENTKRQVDIINHNTGTQTGWHDEAINLITQYGQLPVGDTANRGNVKASACQLIARLDPPYRDTIIVRFEGVNCS